MKRMRQFKRKGFVEIQFNWIFILVIGGIILTFFITIADKQKTVSEVKVSAKVRSDLKTIFTGARASTGTASLVDIADKDITYSCEGFSVNDLNPVHEGISFAPGSLQGFKIMVWSKDWSMPFRVGNILMVTSPNVKYLIVGDSSLSRELNRSLPPKFIARGSSRQLLLNKETVADANTIMNEGNYRIRLIFVNRNPLGTEGLLDINTLEDTDVSALSIMGNSLDGPGELRFYQKRGQYWSTVPGSSNYLGRESLFAAVMADDYKSYNCNMQNLFQRMETVSEVYTQKAGKLQQAAQAAGDTACATQYALSLDALQSIKQHATSLATSFPEQAALIQLHQKAQELRSRNEQAQRLSCSEVY
ncbi:hypothetical protein HYV81_03830 [Candidatus Woesearchaeota archaeon]|nr:hypothetical protein [Candidatus Woesearchaeota archaeon]